MKTCKKNIPFKKNLAEPSEEAFEIIIKKLLSYSEALKYSLHEIEPKRAIGK